MTSASPAAPHLVYVAWGFPPARSGGVYRALATANAFAGAGWQVTVLTTHRDIWFSHTGADTALEALVDPAIDVRRLPFEWPAQETDLSRWSLTRLLFPRLWWRWRKRRDLAAFPEAAYGPWRHVLESAVAQVHRDRPVDLVVATVNPYVDVTPALAMYRRCGVPYVVDYRDAWRLDVFSGDTVHESGSPVGRVEQELMSTARQIWFVNEPIRDWHAERYPAAAARMRVVANGYDVPQSFPPAPARGPLTFGYVGTVSGRVPLAELVEGWTLALRDGGLGDGDRAVLRGYLGYYHVPDPRLRAMLDSAAAAGVSYEGPLSKQDVGRFYAGMDVLLLMLGTGRYVTSGKVYEYLSTGLPIVSVHDPGNAASDVLAGYPHWVAARSLDPHDVAKALAEAAALARVLSPDDIESGRRWALPFQRAAQLSPVIEELTP